MNTKGFIFSYLMNQWKDFLALDQLEELERSLKAVLKLEEVKRVQVINRQTTNESFYQLMLALYPKLSELDFAICEKRLEDAKSTINCVPSTLLCVTAYDLLLNYFLVKKVDLEKIVQTTQKVTLSSKTIKVNSVVKVY